LSSSSNPYSLNCGEGTMDVFRKLCRTARSVLVSDRVSVVLDV